MTLYLIGSALNSVTRRVLRPWQVPRPSLALGCSSAPCDSQESSIIKEIIMLETENKRIAQSHCTLALFPFQLVVGVDQLGRTDVFFSQTTVYSIIRRNVFQSLSFRSQTLGFSSHRQTSSPARFGFGSGSSSVLCGEHVLWPVKTIQRGPNSTTNRNGVKVINRYQQYFPCHQ